MCRWTVVLPRLMLTSLATVLMGGTMFQRRARSGWLEELDDIRGAALVRPDAGMALAMTSPDLEADGPAPNSQWMQRVRDAAARAEADGRGYPVGDVAAELRAGWEPPAPEPMQAAPQPPPSPAVAMGNDALAPPSPHPLRPSEMWHPGSAALGLPGPMIPAEERVDSDSLTSVETTPSGRFAQVRPAPRQPVSDVGREGGLAPILPLARSVGSPDDPMGTRSLGDRPERVLHPATIPPALIAPTHQRAPLALGAEETSGVVDATPNPGLPAEPVALQVSSAGEVEVTDPIMRMNEGWTGRLRRSERTIRADLEVGTLWVSPVDGGDVEVLVTLPSATLVIEPGGGALSVVEADGSVFVVAASGPVALSRGEHRLVLKPGTMVLLPRTGEPQIDHAGPEEIASDPLVAHHRALDARRG